MSCISYGKNTKRHQKSFPEVRKDVFTTAYSIYMLPSILEPSSLVRNLLPT